MLIYLVRSAYWYYILYIHAYLYSVILYVVYRPQLASTKLRAYQLQYSVISSNNSLIHCRTLVHILGLLTMRVHGISFRTSDLRPPLTYDHLTMAIVKSLYRGTTFQLYYSLHFTTEVFTLKFTKSRDRRILPSSVAIIVKFYGLQDEAVQR